MKTLLEDISEIKKSMQKTLLLLSEVDVVHNINPFAEALENMQFVHAKKTELRMKHQNEDLKKYDEELFFLAKQIGKKFDDIVEKQKIVVSALAAELEVLINLKKLTAYK